MPKGTEKMKEVGSKGQENKMTEQEIKSSFQSVLSSGFAVGRIHELASTIEHVHGNALKELEARKKQSEYFIDYIEHHPADLALVDYIGGKMALIEENVASQSRISRLNRPRLDLKIERLRQVVSENKGKSVTDLLLSPTSKRRVTKMDEIKKVRLSKALLLKLHKDFESFHQNYENMMEESTNSRTIKFEEDAKKKESDKKQFRSMLKENSHSKYDRSKSQKKKDKALLKQTKMNLRKFLKGKPMFQKIQEQFDRQKEDQSASVLLQNREWQVSNSMNREKQREHELKIAHLLKRRDLLQSSLKTLQPITPNKPPEFLFKKEKAKRALNYSMVVKENHFPAIDPHLAEASEKAARALARRGKIPDEVLEQIEINKGKGDEYLRDAGRIRLNSMAKPHAVMQDEADLQGRFENVQPLKPRPEIPHFRTKFEGMTIDEICQKIDSHEITEKNYRHIIGIIDQSQSQLVAKEPSKARQGLKGKMDFIVGAMKAKLKILKNLS
jgi:hypothetical protein